MKAPIVKYCGAVLVAALLMIQALPARAEIISTEEALSADQVQADREKVKAFLDRPVIQEELQALGVGTFFAQTRVDSLTDQEVATLARQIDKLPAGGNISDRDLIIILLLILLIAILI